MFSISTPSMKSPVLKLKLEAQRAETVRANTAKLTICTDHDKWRCFNVFEDILSAAPVSLSSEANCIKILPAVSWQLTQCPLGGDIVLQGKLLFIN